MSARGAIAGVAMLALAQPPPSAAQAQDLEGTPSGIACAMLAVHLRPLLATIR